MRARRSAAAARFAAATAALCVALAASAEATFPGRIAYVKHRVFYPSQQPSDEIIATVKGWLWALTAHDGTLLWAVENPPDSRSTVFIRDAAGVRKLPALTTRAFEDIRWADLGPDGTGGLAVAFARCTDEGEDSGICSIFRAPGDRRAPTTSPGSFFEALRRVRPSRLEEPGGLRASAFRCIQRPLSGTQAAQRALRDVPARSLGQATRMLPSRRLYVSD
jgi:hypothetical protein